MTTTMENTMRFGHRLRPLVWGGAAALLLLPAVAMQFTREVQWDAFDFLVMGGMLLAVCLAYETAVRFARGNAYLVAAAIAVGASFLTAWANLAVGIIGSEDNPVNDIFFGVIAVAFVGALLSRLRPRGLAWAMLATAVAQLAACLYAWFGGHGHVFVFTGVMCGLWLTAAQLFRNSASA
ncbi:MAG: hypothetical protein K0M64_07315 [Rhizobium sp.]|nr:hypothetical protein [Rhizobium sp.]